VQTTFGGVCGAKKGGLALHFGLESAESDMGEGRIKVSLVLVHAQDHLMNAMLARELITELIELHEKLNH
ncbi:PTS lactose/cellobiose transporter subunit IIA, partial [Providencia rettgeri]